MSQWRQRAGLARSLVVYRARWWRIAALARFYRGFLSPGDLAFDVGAHVGNRSLAMIRAGASVVALEPQALFHRFLQLTMPRSATVLRLAAGPHERQAALAVSSLHPTVSSLAPGFGSRMAAADPGFRGVSWDNSETVEVTTLDALIARYGVPAFVKIDVEGYEDEVLAGLHRPVARVAFEFLSAAPEVTRACVEHLLRLGPYRFNLVAGERLELASRAWLPGAAILDAVAAAGRSGDVYARLDA